jgi:diguanylate cyclase (GGDEF)-like protein
MKEDDISPLTGTRLPPPRGMRGVWLALTALLVTAGVIGAALGAHAVARSDASSERLSFHLTSAQIASTLELAIQHEEDLVVAARALVGDGGAPLTPRTFDRWAAAVQALARYPELENIGLVKLVPAPQVKTFERRIAAQPVEPFGAGSARLMGVPFEVLPQGARPQYCFAVAGLSRDRASYLPPGLDYCAIAPQLLQSRGNGEASYAPFVSAGTTSLGIETPVYEGGVLPRTQAQRLRTFVGWFGELIVPNVVLLRALQGHSDIAVRFSYASGLSNVMFTQGHVPAHAQTARIDLHNGWTVRTFAPRFASGVLADRNALGLLVGGSLLSLLIGLMIVILGTGRTRALALVREKTSELSHQALHDALTGLPNRALVLDRAEQMLARVARQPGVYAGALFVDIDGFKHVNDRLGHAAGDTLLVTVGERLLRTVRAQDTVGRLGGDEFVVLVETPGAGPALDLLAERLTEVLRAPVDLEGGRHTVAVTASVGVAVGTYSTPDQLLRDADLALYAAKAEGKDRYVLYDPSLDRDASDRDNLEAELGVALAEQQLFLVYQPIFDIREHRAIGVEALVRWRHPQRGVLAPGAFIPLAEESGMIVPIGRWVLREACRQAASWQQRGIRLGISVNVSAFQLGRASFTDDVRSALAESRLDPTLLTLEVTETTVMRDVAGACARLEEVRALGAHVAIDDFGTGYASLSNLQQMPVDVLKVDRSFVAALDDGGQSRELLEAILGVGHALSLAVVAEGIEMVSQMTTLEEIGCEMAQGFLMGRPCSPEAIEELLGRAAADAVPAAAADLYLPPSSAD